MKEFKYTIDGKEYHVAIGGVSDDYVADVTVNGETFQVQMEKPEEPEKKKVELGKPVEEASDDAAPAAQVNAANAVKAPLPGTITSIEVAVGQEVKAGDTVVVLEAMKMQSNFKVSEDCVVREVLVKEGDLVNTDQVLVWLNLNGLEAYGE